MPSGANTDTNWRADLPAITLHVLDGSHPARAVEVALSTRGIEFERVVLPLDGTHPQQVEEIYGAGNQTVPGMLLGDEKVPGSTAILERLDQVFPEEMTLFPAPLRDEVRIAAQWGDEVFQSVGRRLFWGCLIFKPYAAAQAVGGEPMNPEATDFVMKFIRIICKHHGITSVLVAQDLIDMSDHLDRIDAWIADGVLAADLNMPNAADLQIGATISLLQTIGDIRPMIAGRPCEQLASLTGLRQGLVPAGAFPEHWMPTPSAN
ncbi:MAG: glutathione S-transferase N-terminal domain-containing protein [Thermoleophilaceae bacterium]|nr:glutathione S-transferase N-terminal domain-containing protein [Thermoleophilaceae bacterium]